ncbi:MAG: O-antigen ligase family protein [Caldilineaceae bacterium]
MLNLLLELEPVWVALLLPSLLLPEYFWDEWAYPWAIALLFLFWPIRLIYRKRLGPTSPLNLPALLLLLWGVVCCLLSSTPEASWLALGILSGGVALYFALINSAFLQARPIWLILGIGVVGLALAAFGPAILKNIPNKLIFFDNEVNRSQPIDLLGTGETVNSNILAGNLLLPIPFTVAIALGWGWSRRDWGRRLITLFFAAAAVLMAATFILAQSRGGYLALTVALILLFTLYWRWTLLIVGVILAAIVSVSSWDGLVLLAQSIGSDGSVTSLSGRWEIWVGSFWALVNYPLFGIGLGSFEQMMPLLLPQLFSKGTIPHAHNLLLQVGLDLGLPGLIVFLWLWIGALVVQIKTLRQLADLRQEESLNYDQHRSHHNQRRRKRALAIRSAIAAGALATTVAMLLHGMVDAATWGTKPAPLAWVILAVTTLIYQSVNDQEPQPAEATSF